MKIVNITPGLLPIPPNGWGAVEKIIWENHCNFLKLGLESEIKYLNDIDSDDNIVFIHVANLANLAYQRGIPYYFMMHDHHSYLYGKDSKNYKDNLLAIKNAKKAFVPARYLVEYFDNIPEYFSHGVNTDFFQVKREPIVEHKLLCVANNGYAENKESDRKGFGLAIKLAEKFNLPITIAGPKNNENFFKANPQNYNKLNIIYDLNESQLLECYKNHTIFIHLSELEAGHPNMTLLEALSCGLPVVGTLEKELAGIEVVERNIDSATIGLEKILNNYEKYQKEGLTSAKQLSWENRSIELLKKMNINNFDLFKNKLNSSILNTKRLIPKNSDSELQNRYDFTLCKTENSLNYDKVQVNFNFHDGAFIEIKGCKEDAEYEVNFIDDDSGKNLYGINLKNNHWARCDKSHYTNYVLSVKKSGIEIFNHKIDLKNKNVFINLDTKSLGDSLAWVPYVEEFRKKHQCHVYCATFFNSLFEKSYPEIKFILYQERGNFSFYAKYNLGFFFTNQNARKKYPSSIPLQEVACDILGLSYKEIKPKLNAINNGNKFKKPYVCIGIQSTSQAKYWNNKTGWYQVVDYIKSKGYDVVCIDKYKTFGCGDFMNTSPSNATDCTGDLPLENRISDILNCEFFIGLGSGLSWLAWALNKPVILISGFSNPISEFYTPYRLFNGKVCNSCWNDVKTPFDLHNWAACPKNKDFECSREISFEMVKEKIDLLIK